MSVAAGGILLASACSFGTVSTPIDPGREASRHRAALATVVVSNQTALPLFIAFRPAAGPGAEVVVGDVGAHATATVAPIPAAEPIVLVARQHTGEQLELAPRSFAIDTTWTWIIPAEARFVPRAARGS
jgi:hypothetical protein